MSTQKIVTLVVWIAGLLAALFATGIVGTIGKGLIGFLVVAHLIECFVFRKELEEAPGSMGAQLVQVFLFGVIHMQELREGGGAGGEA
jgi:uncharacterized protein YhhL (DUF1145 family)